MYSISVREPNAPAWTPENHVATVENEPLSPFTRLLTRFRVLEIRYGAVPLPSSDNKRYTLTYSYTVPGPLLALAALSLWLAFWVMLALWLYQDAKLRLGKQALPWFALGLVGGPIAIAIWLIQRPSPPPPPPHCPSCQIQQVQDATYCVACGAHLKPTCTECGRAVERSWRHCPTCGHHLDQETA
jgi:hypothetical protein